MTELFLIYIVIGTSVVTGLWIVTGGLRDDLLTNGIVFIVAVLAWPLTLVLAFLK
jgi:hypothetical protein